MAITSLSVGWPCGSVVYAQTHTDMWLSYCSSLVFSCVKIPAIHTVVKNRALSWSLVCFQCFNAHLHVSKSQISSLSTSSIHTHTHTMWNTERQTKLPFTGSYPVCPQWSGLGWVRAWSQEHNLNLPQSSVSPIITCGHWGSALTGWLNSSQSWELDTGHRNH